MASTSLHRVDFLQWDEYFIGVSILTAQRSKDPKTQVGCVIVDTRYRVVGAGYNGMPWGCPDTDMPWGKDEKDPLQDKNTFVCHAEMNAVMNKNCVDLEGCRLYTTLFPCNECAKIVVQSRMAEVIYVSDRDSWKMDASKRLFDQVGITYRQFIPKRNSITIDFTKHT
ncbi:hypothetical protein PENTCL1PPCAC_22827 [Pristionchus entomophagus]|uniref:Probable deoxycytidylate deaminase n=1 Tax=Pristionchus entomophagus TaxID=358040 RepID=A0AAV5U2P2_9BILA|nr:hypothetical protein PENTCL1PPCAC_22827 [Pristionchus entomophagus]